MRGGQNDRVNLRRATEADRAALANLAEQLQRRPDRHVAYLGLDAASIAEELTEDVDDWTEAAVLAESDGRLLGWLMGSIDHDMGRVWWFGPFVADDEPGPWRQMADELDRAARALLPPEVTEEEYAPDERYVLLVEWARARGAVADTGSAVLSLDGGLDPPSVPARPVRDDDRDALVPLHELLFPATHTTGAELVVGRDERRLRLVAHDASAGLVGYVAVERQADGSGYIDYLGVDPSHRRRGLGADLVRAGVAALRERGCERVHLTVRTDNAAARSLYASLGFVEERVILPLRIGFSLG